MTSLRFAGLKPKTVQCYRRAIRAFFQYLEDEDEGIAKTSRTFDRQLSRYIEHMWMDDQPIAYGGHLLSGLRRFMPTLRWKTPEAKQFFSNWQATHVSRQTTPMPPEVVMAFAGLAVETKQFGLGALLLIGFLAFLRTGEMVSLHPTKVMVDKRRGRVFLALPNTKTSRQREETVCIEDVRVAKLVAYFLVKSPHVSFWVGSASAFRATLKEFASFFHLGGLRLTAYSIRRGGASYAFSSGASFDELMVKGRWQSPKTARLYLDTGRAALIQTRFTPPQASLLDRYAHKLYCFCEQLR